jgi:hypothetical protein
MRARLDEILAELATLKAFEGAVERGEHDNEARIASAVAGCCPLPEPRGSVFRRSTNSPPDTRADQVRQIQRMTLQQQALDRMNTELFPELRDLRFKLSIL